MYQDYKKFLFKHNRLYNKMSSASTEPERKKKLMIGLPGLTFSNQFLMGWTQFMVELIKNNEFEISISPGYSTFSPFTRMKTLGLNKQAISAKAFNSTEYDVFVTIDSNILFTYEHVKKLVHLTDKYPVASGVYMTTDKTVCAIERMDYSVYNKKGSFDLVSMEKIESIKETPILQVEFSGMGFFACRRDVLQTLDYPYFWYQLIDFTAEDGTPCRDVPTEEVAFCRRLRDKGYTINLDTSLRVLQEKHVVF